MLPSNLLNLPRLTARVAAKFAAALSTVLLLSAPSALWANKQGPIGPHCSCEYDGIQKKGTRPVPGVRTSMCDVDPITGTFNSPPSPDYVSSSSPGEAGCASCSGGPGSPEEGSGDMPRLEFKRMHRSPLALVHSSLGTNAALTYDVSLEIASGTIRIYDPQLQGLRFDTQLIGTGIRDDYGQKSIKDLRTYDAAGVLTSSLTTLRTAVLTTTDGRTYQFEFFSTNPDSTVAVRHGRITKIADRNGNGITFTYQFPANASNASVGNDRGQLWKWTKITDAYGKTAAVQYTKAGSAWVISRIDLPNGKSIQYSYGTLDYGKGPVTSLTGTVLPDLSVVKISSAFDAATGASVVTFQDPAATGMARKKSVYFSRGNWVDPATGISTAVEAGRVVQILNGNNEVTFATRTWVEPVTGKTHILIRDGAELLSVFETDGSPLLVRRARTWAWSADPSTYTWDTVSTNTWDNYQNLLSTTNGRGEKTTFVNNVWGWARTLRYPDSTVENISYNTFNFPVSRTDRIGRVSSYTYDAKGNLLSKTLAAVTADAAAWQWEYNAQGQLTRALDADYDAAHPDLHVTEYQYSSTGNPDAVDGRGYLVRIIEAADVAGGVRGITKMTYDAAGRLFQKVDPVGRKVEYAYDAMNRTVQITYYMSSGLEYERFAFQDGLPTTSIDRNGNAVTYMFDASGRKVVEGRGLVSGGSDPAAPAYTGWTYVPGTTLIQSVRTGAAYLQGANPAGWTKGQLTEYRFDGQGRVVDRITYANQNRALDYSTGYDAFNRSDRRTDPFGRNTYTVYDINNRGVRTVKEWIPGGAGAVPSAYSARVAFLKSLPRLAVPNPAYVIEDFAYDAAGNMINRIDGNGIVTNITYNGRGLRTEQDEASGTPLQAKTTFTYDPQGNQIFVAFPRTFAEGMLFRTRSAYNGRNLIAFKTEADSSADSSTERYSYGPDGRLTDRTDALGRITTTLWRQCCPEQAAQLDPPSKIDGSGLLKRSATIMGSDPGLRSTYTATVKEIPAGASAAWLANPPEFDGTGGELFTIKEQTRKYDAQNRLISRTDWLQPLPQGVGDCWKGLAGGDPGTPDAYLMTRTLYDDDLTDGSGLDVDYAGQIARLGSGFFGSKVNGKAVETISPEGRKSVTVFDGLGRVVLVIDGKGQSTLTVYDNLISGLVATKRADALNHATSVRTDGAGNPRVTYDALGKAALSYFDNNGNEVKQVDANGVGYRSSFDARNREYSRIDTRNETLFRKEFDAHGNAVKTYDGLGKPTARFFDRRDRLVKSVDPLGFTTLSAFDRVGNTVRLTDEEGKVTTYAYDAKNLLIAETFPLGQYHDADANADGYPDARTRTYGYDAAGRKVLRLDQKLQKTQYVYDMAGRLTVRKYADGLDDSLAYNPDGGLDSALSKRYGTKIKFAYDKDIPLLTSETQIVAGVGRTVSYAYNQIQLQTGLTYPDGKKLVRTYTSRDELQNLAYNGAQIAALQYDNGGRRTTTTFGNGLVEERAYRTGDNFSDYIRTSGGVTDFTYQFDADKRMTLEDDGSAANNDQGFAYDLKDRLTAYQGKTDQGWVLSPVGDWKTFTQNGMTQVRTHDNAHELLNDGGHVLPYDEKGNQIRSASGDEYVWDAENRLAQVNFASGTSARYTYDALGRRLAKLVNGVSTVFVHSGSQVIAEYPSGSPLKAYVYGPFVDEPLAVVEGTGTSYFHVNRNYSVTALTNAAGQVIERYAYGPYGDRTVLAPDGATVRAVSAVGNQVGFTGRYLDQETGLWNFRARMYSSEQGRFIGRDMSGYDDGFDLYSAYFAPQGVDPSGNKRIDDPQDLKWSDFTINPKLGYAAAVGVEINLEPYPMRPEHFPMTCTQQAPNANCSGGCCWRCVVDEVKVRFIADLLSAEVKAKTDDQLLLYHERGHVQITIWEKNFGNSLIEGGGIAGYSCRSEEEARKNTFKLAVQDVNTVWGIIRRADADLNTSDPNRKNSYDSVTGHLGVLGQPGLLLSKVKWGTYYPPDGSWPGPIKWDCDPLVQPKAK